jgi:hypothetical protein
METPNMKFKKLTLLACFLCLSFTAMGQKYLEKPYQKWSKDEALRVITDSPWARTYQSTEGAAAAAARDVGREQSQGRIGASSA